MAVFSKFITLDKANGKIKFGYWNYELSDYVIESDSVWKSSANMYWNYRKWASGVVEIWSTKFSLTGTTSSLMGGYYSQWSAEGSGILSLPCSVGSSPIVYGSARLGTGLGFLNAFVTTSRYGAEVSSIACCGNQNSTAINDISITIIGRWDEA